MNLSTIHQNLYRFPGSDMVKDSMIPHTYTEVQEKLLSLVASCTQDTAQEFSQKLDRMIESENLSESAIRQELLSNPLLLNWLSHLR
ncbi:MAG: hypothetical protein C0582_00870 [Alphaproteobacteria bacterium]|nr:MAG: hypothetical protein C0582_00870 [Alphaproteobacteria bacterium]